MRLETERLCIRNFVLDDLESHHKLISNTRVMKYISDIQTHSLEESRNNLEFSINELKKDKPTCYFFGIFEKENESHIGSIGFSIEPLSERKSAELGYFIHEKYWGQGYTLEAVSAILNYAFSTLDLHKMITGCAYLNTNSEKIMKKIGMIKEGHLLHHASFDGIDSDRVTYGMFNSKHMSQKDKVYITIMQLIQNHEDFVCFAGDTVDYINGTIDEIHHIEVIAFEGFNHSIAYELPVVLNPETISLKDVKVINYYGYMINTRLGQL